MNMLESKLYFGTITLRTGAKQYIAQHGGYQIFEKPRVDLHKACTQLIWKEQNRS